MTALKAPFNESKLSNEAVDGDNLMRQVLSTTQSKLQLRKNGVRKNVLTSYRGKNETILYRWFLRVLAGDCAKAT